ncbi:MAG: hypothetical protein HYS39_02575 [Proteobacteria bacterium]|nr:hypothetical protein [Pseudomonadota bacterium]
MPTIEALSLPPKIPNWQTQEADDTKDITRKSALSQLMDKNVDKEFDVFLQMFITQVRNQDPSSPIDTFQMTQSLLQFFLARSQVDTNITLKELTDLLKTDQARAAEQWLGRQVFYEGNKFTFDGNPKTIEYDVPVALKEGLLRVYDNIGTFVQSLNLEKTAGKHRIQLDGQELKKLEKNKNYTYLIEAIDENKKKVDVKSITQGIIDSLEYDQEGSPVFQVGMTPVTPEQIVRLQKSIKKYPTEDTSALQKISQSAQVIQENKSLGQSLDIRS